MPAACASTLTHRHRCIPCFSSSRYNLILTRSQVVSSCGVKYRRAFGKVLCYPQPTARVIPPSVRPLSRVVPSSSRAPPCGASSSCVEQLPVLLPCIAALPISLSSTDLHSRNGTNHASAISLSLPLSLVHSSVHHLLPMPSCYWPYGLGKAHRLTGSVKRGLYTQWSLDCRIVLLP
jgi:hypothetical protein